MKAPVVLLVSRDTELREDVEHLAIGAGASIVCADDVSSAVDWSGAGLVLVDARAWRDGDGAPVRAGIVVVGRPGDRGAWDVALAVGADHVAVLPDATSWLAGRIAVVANGGVGGGVGGARLVAVVGGSGGAGASVLAVAVAVTAARSGAALLIDVDPLGGGLDLVLGAEDTGGSRWPELAGVSGSLGPDVLPGTLPIVDGLTLLSCERRDLLELPPAAVAAVVVAGRHGHDVVVADLPRRLDPAAREVVRHADRVVVVVVSSLRGVASAARVIAQYRTVATDLAVVVRRVPRGLDPEEVADALDLPLAGVVRTDRGLTADLESGVAPGTRPRGGLAILAGRLLADLP